MTATATVTATATATETVIEIEIDIETATAGRIVTTRAIETGGVGGADRGIETTTDAGGDKRGRLIYIFLKKKETEETTKQTKPILSLSRARARTHTQSE